MSRLPPETISKLVNRARRASESAYAPYSKFSVGAVVLADDGTIYEGANLENASYGLTICAERLAIYKAVFEGRKQLAALAVFTPTETITQPCGSCRQVAYEFAPDMMVICASRSGMSQHVVHELLPGAFGPLDLGH